MSELDRTEDSDGEMKEQAGASAQAPPLEEALRAARSATERRTLVGLARGLGKLPGDTARAAVETSAAIAGVSLRGSIEFLRAAPEAARVLEA
ncbi:MAG: hypothetical protein H0U81_03405, partial [Pyrinomonadaceae bacterium]|nr:hypothetical protein [Pyrinomonadaceae bacterium]